jgi:hypothetical protein
VRDLDHAARQDPHQERRERDEEDRLMADEAVRLRRRVEDRRELVHQRDDADREPREIPLAARRKAEQILAAEDRREDDREPHVQEQQDGDRHGRSRSRAGRVPLQRATPGGHRPMQDAVGRCSLHDLAVHFARIVPGRPTSDRRRC